MKSTIQARVSRRGALAGALSTGVSGIAAQTAKAQPIGEAQISRWLNTYASFGDKASGGEGDNACGDWLIKELQTAGYSCSKQTFDVPAFEGRATLATGATEVDVIPQAVVVTTAAGGLQGRLHLHGEPGGMRGDIRLIILPHRRWSSIVGAVARQVDEAFAGGAAGAVLVTTGPSGEALALNAPADRPLFAGPVAVLAPRAAQTFISAARRGETGTLSIQGKSFRRQAFNVTAKLDRGTPRDLVLSTPRSGWFGCVGERGPGIAAWLSLARWAATAPISANVHLLCTSGHEYENRGGALYLEHLAPPPSRTALWVHLGANLAARDWHELGAELAPLPGADAQRYLLASSDLIAPSKRAFAGQPGLEQVYPATPQGAAGELTHILKAGYVSTLGVFGAHRLHHSRGDDLRTVSPVLVQAAAEAFRQVISQHLQA